MIAIEKNIMKNKPINLLGVRIDSLTLDEFKSKTSRAFQMSGHRFIFTPNPEIVYKASKDINFKDVLNKSYLNIPDGIGILWAAKFLTFRLPKNIILKYLVAFIKFIGSLILIPFLPSFFKKPIPGRVSGSDFFWDVVKICQENSYRIFLLGGAPTIAEKTSLVIQNKFPDIKIVGIHSGGPSDKEEIIAAVKKSRADILFVAFGAPKQELFIAQNLKQTNCKIGMGVGGTFDFVSGNRKRAPLMMRKIGLEWFYRLWSEPKRFKRQLSLPKFLFAVLKRKATDH